MAAISAGPYFKLNESASLMVHFRDKAELDRVFQLLSEGGRILMPLGEYLFNPYYVWFEDRFGLSWQFLLVPQLDKSVHLDILPSLLRRAGWSGQTLLRKSLDHLPRKPARPAQLLSGRGEAGASSPAQLRGTAPW
ncbi:MAG: VOC family protein [Streptococcus sp.]